MAGAAVAVVTEVATAAAAMGVARVVVVARVDKVAVEVEAVPCQVDKVD